MARAGRAQFPTDPRSDSLDITRQHIDLTITDFTNKTVNGYSTLDIKAIAPNVQGIQLDLFEFQVDSVKIDGNSRPFT